MVSHANLLRPDKYSSPLFSFPIPPIVLFTEWPKAFHRFPRGIGWGPRVFRAQRQKGVALRSKIRSGIRHRLPFLYIFIARVTGYFLPLTMKVAEVRKLLVLLPLDITFAGEMLSLGLRCRIHDPG